MSSALLSKVSMLVRTSRGLSLSSPLGRIGAALILQWWYLTSTPNRGGFFAENQGNSRRWNLHAPHSMNEKKAHA